MTTQQKISLLIDYEEKGLITPTEFERLVDEQQVGDSEEVSNCCFAKLDISKAFCSDCGEQN